MDWFTWLTEGRALGLAALAGAAGGLVRTFALKQRTWREFVINITAGAVCSLYIGPVLQPFLVPLIGELGTEANITSFSGFIAGVCGITAAGWLIDALPAFLGRKKD